MNIERAKEKIKQLGQFIETMEAYEPKNFEQEAFKLYVELESVSKVAEILKGKGYKIGNRKVISKDISDLIRTKPTDHMHEMAQASLKRNTSRMKKSGWL